MGVDWTQVIVFGVPAYIAAIFAGVASIISARTRRDVATSNGHTVGELVEQTHALATENADAIATINGTTEED